MSTPTTPPDRTKLPGRRRPAREKPSAIKPTSRPDMSGYTLQISADAVAASLASDSDRKASFA